MLFLCFSTQMDEIRSWWQVPSIAHFCSLFRSAFALTDFDIEDLEDALVISGGQEESRFLADLHARLLRGLFSKKADINASNFEPFLSEVLKVRWTDDPLVQRKNPLDNVSYHELSIWEKVEILHDLCNWRLDCDDVTDHLKGMEADSLRVEPLGCDACNNTYWYFSGTRLYKEHVEKTDTKELGKKKLAKKRRRLKKKKRLKKHSSSESDAETSSDSEYLPEEEEEEEESESEEELRNEDMVFEDNAKRTWSLVCSTKEDWEDLTKTFSKSHNRREIRLHQALTVDFLAEISQMLENKEKAFRKKLLVEVAPRRSSDRIAIKAQQKEEEDKQAEIERIQEKERLAEIKKQEAEAKEKERQVLAEKRQKERAERARLRQERQWIMMNGGDVPEEILQSLEKTDDGEESEENEEKKLDDLDKAFEGDIDMFTGMYKVVESLKNHEDGWPFLEPVEESYAPNYFEIIEKPMDLSTIEKKIDEKNYKGLKEFISDMKLMFNNCLEYNGENSSYTQMAQTLEGVFQRQMKKHFPDDDNPSSDDDFEEELTESELRKLNKKRGDVNGAEEDSMTTTYTHKPNQMFNPRANPALFAQHFAMNPMAADMARMMQDPMAFQRMPYMRQPFYPPQMFPGQSAYPRYNMNNFPRGPGSMYPPHMMGVGHPAYRMNQQTPVSIRSQEVPPALVRGESPIATKGEASSMMWTNNRDNRPLGNPYSRPPMVPGAAPWQTSARMALPGWRPSVMLNGVRPPVSSQQQPADLLQGPGTSGGGAGSEVTDEKGLKNIGMENATTGTNMDGKIRETGVSVPTSSQPSEEDLRFPFVVNQDRTPAPANPVPSIQRSSPSTSDGFTTRSAGKMTGVEEVKASVDTVESEDGKVFVNLTSKSSQQRVGEKRSNPYSILSLMDGDNHPAKRSSKDPLKFSALLQEMSQSRRPDHLIDSNRSNDPSRSFMDLSRARNELPTSVIGLPSSNMATVESRGEIGHPAHGVHARIPGPSDMSTLMNMRSAGSMMSPARGVFPPDAIYPGYANSYQREQMLMFEQQQRQQMMQRAGYRPLPPSMMTNGMPRNTPPEYSYYPHGSMFGGIMGQYMNGSRPPSDDVSNKNSRVS